MLRRFLQTLQQQQKILQFLIPLQVAIVVIFFLLAASGTSLSSLSEDLYTTAHLSIDVGLISNAGIMLRALTAVICVYTAFVALRLTPDRRLFWFWLHAGLWLTVLFVDDAFFVNEAELEARGIREIYMWAADWFVWITLIFIFRDIWRKTAYIPLFLGSFLLIDNLLLDVLKNTGPLVDFLHKYYRPMWVIDEGTKMLGILAVSAYFVTTGLEHISTMERPEGYSPPTMPAITDIVKKQSHAVRLMAIIGFVTLVIETILMFTTTPSILRRISQEATSVADLPLDVGALQTIGAIFWSAAAGICFFVAGLLIYLNLPRRKWGFYVYSGLLLSFLLVDDAFRFHEALFTGIGIPEVVTYGGYFLSLVVFMVFYREELQESPYILFFIGAGLLGISAVVDSLHHHLGSINTRPRIRWFIEDGVKMIGVPIFTTYFMYTAAMDILPRLNRTTQSEAVEE